MIQKEGRYYYNFWRDAKNPRGLWRRTTLEEYRRDQPAWEVVLDLDELGRQEHENWVWHGADVLKPGHRRALISHLLPAHASFSGRGVDLAYSRYRKRDTDEMDESFFPVVWDESGYRTPWLDG